jgi:predicted glycogen debranching enzyme
MINLNQEKLNSFMQSSNYEWLATNGIGGFASSSVSGANTRRYHGLLIASLRPPSERVLLVSKVEEVVTIGDGVFELGVNEYGDGTIHPQGFSLIKSFYSEMLFPVWHYQVSDAVLEKTIWMEHGENITYLRYRLLEAKKAVTLELRPFLVNRDFHHHNIGAKEIKIIHTESSICVAQSGGVAAVNLTLDGAKFKIDEAWHWNIKHRIEAARGLDSTEDLYTPGYFYLNLEAGQEVTLCLSVAGGAIPTARDSYQRELARRKALLTSVSKTKNETIKTLFLAADQFIVERAMSRTSEKGKSIIAGYPWFADWSRDTMIALSGLTLSTNRPEIAREILLTFSNHLNRGMLPNRFPDTGEELEYNSVDGALLFINAVYQYWLKTRDKSLLDKIYSSLQEIIHFYKEGTRYNIHADTDGLIVSGERGVQLTWMDAKVGDWVVTPRMGKAVEINAMWYNALCAMSEFSRLLKLRTDSKNYMADSKLVKKSLQKFWNKEALCLFDVIDCIGVERDFGSNDSSIRPNQLFASGLLFSALSKKQIRSVVDICTEKLLTPFGLRTLSPEHKDYLGRYQGDQLSRDGAYHQGTVWPWLIGIYVDSYLKVYSDRKKLKVVLEPLEKNLADSCIGSFSEIFDGDEPQLSQGCFAQAWSVGEFLRIRATL